MPISRYPVLDSIVEYRFLITGQTYLMKTLISSLFNIQHGKPLAYNKTEIFFADMNGVSADPTIQLFIIS